MMGNLSYPDSYFLSRKGIGWVLDMDCLKVAQWGHLISAPTSEELKYCHFHLYNKII
jgi:hypothetical protein